jgi:hypothetical protein
MKKIFFMIFSLLILAACAVEQPVGEPPERINFEGSSYVATGAVLEDPSVIEDSGYKAEGYTIYVDTRDDTHLAIFIRVEDKYYIWLKEEALPPMPPANIS